MRTVEIRLYGGLNDFVALERRGRTLRWEVFGTPSVKDVLEAVGPPHPELGLVLIDGEASGLSARLKGGERVVAYPADSAWAASHPGSVAPAPLAVPRFLLDGHLGALASTLRLDGFDVELPAGAEDATLARRSAEEDRILLTRDLGLLKRSEVRRGAYVRATDPAAQELEIVRRFRLVDALAPLTRCSACNGELREVARDRVKDRVPEGVLARCEAFRECPRCERVYWEGSHPARIRARIDGLRAAVRQGSSGGDEPAGSTAG